MSISDARVPIILWSSPGEQAEQDCACAEGGFTPTIYASRPERRIETDCACPDDGFTLSPLPGFDAHSCWQQVPELYQESLPDNHLLLFNPFGPASVVVLNEPARAIIDSFAQPHPLDSDTSRQLAALGLIQPYGTTPMPICLKPRMLTAWLHVTNACNLRCTYCYLAKTDEAMDEITGRAAIDAVFRSAIRHGFRAIKLKYAGGEPTLNFGLVRILHDHASRLAECENLELHEVVLSNGVALSNSILDFIRDTGIRLMISIDGLGAVHDAQRVFPNGRGSSHLVVRNVDQALARCVKPYLSITVTKHNADDIAEIVAFALERDLLFNLNFYRENGHAATHENLAAEDARLIAGAQAAFKIIEERLPQQSLIATLLDRANFSTPHDRPCGAGHNYLVIDQNGRVARCQMEIKRTVTDITVKDPLGVIRTNQIGFHNLPVDEKDGCRECVWRYWCAGGCPLLTYRVTGRNDVKSPYCNVYQALYPEVLRLEGLRLLKWKVPRT